MSKSDATKSDGAKSSGAMGTVVAMMLLTSIGGGGGGFLGYMLAVSPSSVAQANASKPTKAPAGGAPAGDAHAAPVKNAHGGATGDQHADAHGGGHGKNEHGKDHEAPDAARHDDVALQVKELPTIVTNLAQPDTSWIRLQAAIVYDPNDMQHADKLIAELMSDITAFLRNVTLSSLEGADGLRRLQEDLTERAAIRSDRKIREVIIETMVVQ